MFRKISQKLILIVSATVVLIIGVYSYLNIASQSDVLLGEVERHANQLSETVKNSTRYGMLLNQQEHVHEIINTIGKDPKINDIKILNKEGEIIYSTIRNDIGKMLDKNAESCYACHAENKPIEKLPIKERTRIFRINPDSTRLLGIINPIYNEKSCYEADCHAHDKSSKMLGLLDITISLKDIDDEIFSNKVREVIFTLIAIIAVGFIIAIFVKQFVDKPVQELIKATDQVSSGNLHYKIADLGNDELGTLAKSFNDMTEKLDEVSRQLYQSTKLASLGQLAAGVAHEINNPLTGVLTYSSFLLKRTKDNLQMQEDLNVIVRETTRCREIVKGLLDFARQSTPKKSVVDINEIVTRAISVINNQLKIHKVVLEKNFDTSLPKITADINQIEQVFLNLFVNAIDAIGTGGGKIKVTTSQIELSPKGITHIKNAVCGKTHSLIDPHHKIGGNPSIKVKARSTGIEGFIYLDSVYGIQRHDFGIAIDRNSPIQITCPSCDISLIDKNGKCPICGGPVYKIQIPNQGYIEGCALFNDDWQVWGFLDSAGEKKFIQIDVEDSGSGIPPEHLSKIFEPFFSTKGQKGTGLGLSVIWGIVDNHDGTISVQSEIGKGTTFSLRLPVGEQKFI